MKISKIRDVKTPNRGTPESAGLDFFVPNDFEATEVPPGGSVFIPSGIRANVPGGYALIAFNKSGVALKKNLSIGACVVDEDYQGEIHLHLYNFGNKETVISPGEKLVQMVLVPVSYDTIEVVQENYLFESASTRGSGGFGSTGNF